MNLVRKMSRPKPKPIYVAPPPAAPEPVAASVPLGIFRSAITEKDNVSINVGYLSLFWIMVVVLNVIPFMVIGACVEAYNSPTHMFPYAELGKGVGLVTAAFAAALAALGGFIWGDSNKDKVATTTVTATTSGPASNAA